MGMKGARRGIFETVLIGHSMGGLVIKRAYKCAAYKYWPNASTQSFFLRQPIEVLTRPKLLNNILHFAHSFRAYVERGFGAVQFIKDEFRNYSADVHLCSFYETQKYRINVAKGWMSH